MFWDTLGWVYFRLGRLDEAETYLYAAWLLLQGGIEADHLGQVYEQEKKTEKAIHMYRLALTEPQAVRSGGAEDETRRRLELLTGSKVPTNMGPLRDDPNGNELSQMRKASLKRIVPDDATADFYLLFGPGGKIEDVHFIQGSESLKVAGRSALSEASFEVAFPKGSSARLIRRAIVTCSGISGCNAVLFTPDSVTPHR
jgi:hypothetical protein